MISLSINILSTSCQFTNGRSGYTLINSKRATERCIIYVNLSVYLWRCGPFPLHRVLVDIVNLDTVISEPLYRISEVIVRSHRVEYQLVVVLDEFLQNRNSSYILSYLRVLVRDAGTVEIYSYEHILHQMFSFPFINLGRHQILYFR